jgi:hypothetical protein
LRPEGRSLRPNAIGICDFLIQEIQKGNKPSNINPELHNNIDKIKDELNKVKNKR